MYVTLRRPGRELFNSVRISAGRTGLGDSRAIVSGLGEGCAEGMFSTVVCVGGEFSVEVGAGGGIRCTASQNGGSGCWGGGDDKGGVMEGRRRGTLRRPEYRAGYSPGENDGGRGAWHAVVLPSEERIIVFWPDFADRNRRERN